VIVFDATVESVGSARIEVVLLFYSLFVELVIDVNSCLDQYIQCWNDSTITHKFVLDIFLEAALEHSHKSIVVLLSDKGILLELDCVF